MKRFAVIGRGIKYTRSPFVHGEICRLAGKEAVYDTLDFPLPELRERVKYLKENYDGFNITKPYKAEITQYLDKLDRSAEETGAINTVSKTSDGKLIGYNTDPVGFVDSLNYHSIDLTGRSALILGAGGAAKAVIKALLRTCSEIKVFNRTYEHALETVEQITNYKLQITNNRVLDKEECNGQWTMDNGQLKDKSKIVNYQLSIIVSTITAVKQLPVESCAIINCTTAGYKENESPLPPDFDFSGFKAAIDLIYSPRETPFLKVAKQAGLKTANGAAMLFYQALKAQYIWQGITLTKDKAKSIIEAI